MEENQEWPPAAGRSRSSGSGTCRSPFAQFVSLTSAAPAVQVAVVGRACLRLGRFVTEVAKVVEFEVVSPVHEVGQQAHTLIRTLGTCVVWLLTAGALLSEWMLGQKFIELLKRVFGRTGRDPEGNTGSSSSSADRALAAASRTRTAG